MMNTSLKRIWAILLSVMMLALAATSFAQGTATPAEGETKEPQVSQPTPKPIAAPGAQIEVDEDTIRAKITGEKGLAIYADLSGDTRYDLYAGDVVEYTGLAAGVYEFEADYHEAQKGVSAFRTSIPVAGKTTPAPVEDTPAPQEQNDDGEKPVAAPGADIEIDKTDVRITVSGEAGLRMYVDAGIGWDDEVYAGETVTFSGFEAGKTYDVEVDYYEPQKGVSAYRTSISFPAQEEDKETPTPEPITSATPEAPAVQITPEAPPHAEEESAAAAQFKLSVSHDKGVITANVTEADAREVELLLLFGGEKVETRAIIGNGSVQFSKQGDGMYTVRAAYVTPVSGVGPVEKTIEITGTGEQEQAPEEKTPTVKQIGAQVTSGDNWIEVKVTDADNWPLYVAVGSEHQMVSLGKSVRFSGLNAGEHAIEVDYIDPVAGVTPFRSVVTLLKAPAGQIVFSASGGENRIEVIVSEASVLPVSVVVKKDGNQTAKKMIDGGVGKATFTGLSAGEYTVVVNYEPAQSGVSAQTQSGIVVVQAPPQIKEIVFSAAGGARKIDVSVTDASNLPVCVTVLRGNEQKAQKTIAAGVGNVTFTGLSAGEYSVSVNYDPAQEGISAKTLKGIMVIEQTQPITITKVSPGENVIRVEGSAHAGMDIALTTKPAAQNATLARTGSDGRFAAEIILSAGTYTQVKAAYASDNSIFDVKEGTFIVTAPTDKPGLTVDEISNKTQNVLARTNPGVTVNLRVKAYNYGQTIVADSRGLLKYSLPQTYPKGTVVTFTVYYGRDNAQSYTKDVTVSSKTKYRVLQYGDTGDEVEEMTERLRDLGYMEDDTRRFSSAVREAVKLFQRLNGLDVDGIAGQETLERLYSVAAVPYGDSGEYTLLVRGDRGAAVVRLQQRLKDLGYYTIAVDGIFGSGTERSVRHFQRINGLPKTGRADEATQRLLYSSSAKPADSGYADDYKTLSRSPDYHPAVVPLQRRLKALGYSVGSVDGYFGSRTQRAVREFQRRNGLKVTGVADVEMQRVLYSSSAVPGPGAPADSDDTSYRLLTWGSRGDDVKRLQNALIAAGYKQVRVADGIYGQWTYDAVRAYQRDHGLVVDGIAGKATQNSLYGTNY